MEPDKTYTEQMQSPYAVDKKRNSRIINARAKWMKRTKNTTRTIADRTGFDWNTVVRWTTLGRTPRSLYREALLAVFPDFPISA